MLLNWIIKWKWRRLRLKIWQKRLHKELENTLTNAAWKPSMEMKLRISWGPFYNGAAWFNPARNEATILLQLPYDHYLTDEEIKVLQMYQLPLASLPYFILNHEFYHLMDILADSDEQAIRQRITRHQELARLEKEYRHLSFEQEADQFAYRCYREKNFQAC